MDEVTRRLVFAEGLRRQEFWGPWAWLAATGAGWWQKYLDSWANTSTAEWWKSVTFLSAPWWFALAFALLAGWVFEASYKRQRPTLRVFFGDPRFGVAWEPAPNPPAIAKPLIYLLILTVKNGHSEKLEDCQVQVRVKNDITPGLETMVFVVSRPFSLRMDEHKQIHLLSYEFDAQRPGLSLTKYHNDADGVWYEDDTNLTLPPGTHKITVEALSAQSRMARTKFEAVFTDRWHFYQRGKELLG